MKKTCIHTYLHTYLPLVIVHKDTKTNSGVTSVIFLDSQIDLNSPLILETFPALKSIEFSNVGLEKLLPMHNCSVLRAFSSSFNLLSTVSGGVFNQCTNLYYINLFGNRIDHIEDEAFDKLENLVILDLGMNSISTLSPRTFSSLSNLQKLYLSKNRIKIISQTLLQNSHRLEQLELDENLIEKIHPGILRNMTSLKVLNLNQNNLEDIHAEAFKDLRALTQVSLKGNQLKVLHKLFVNNNALESLDFSDNKIDSIHPEWLQNTPALSFLKLDGNTCVDETFFGNDFNNYETFIHPALEKCFQQYQKLSTILDQTQICDFHFNAIGYTCSLENVFLSDENSSFAISGEHFDGMTNNEVEAVAFKGSNLLTIPPEIFVSFPKAEKLFANHSGIERADKDTLSVCGQLMFIDMSDNRISILTDDAFQNCSYLTVINLSNNLIVALPARVFHKNLDLQSINLDGNQISVIDPCNNIIRFELRKLQNLSLRGNICINNSYDHPILHLLFNEIALRDIKICYGYWFFH